MGCGLFLALFGLVLLTDLGVWLIKGIGWLFLILGLILVVSGIYYWLTGSRRRY